MNETLKPCPFCGGDHIAVAPSDGGGNEVHCGQCRGAMWSGTEESARESWNRRTPDPANARLMAACVEAMQHREVGEDPYWILAGIQDALAAYEAGQGGA